MFSVLHAVMISPCLNPVLRLRWQLEALKVHTHHIMFRMVAKLQTSFSTWCRDDLMQRWVASCQARGIPVSADCTLRGTLATPVEVCGPLHLQVPLKCQVADRHASRAQFLVLVPW